MKRTLVFLIFVSLISINPRINGWNEASRMALTQSLVEHDSFSIDESTFLRTGDKVYIDGHFYSDKPPLPSMLAALVYWPLYQLGFRLENGWNLSYYLIILLTVKLFWLAAVLAFKKTLVLLQVERDTIPFFVVIFAFASIMFTWSATFNNHSLAASSMAIAFMYYLSGKIERKHTAVLVSGFFFGLAGAMDIPTSIFLVGFSLLVFNEWKLSRTTISFISAALIPLSLHLAVNYSIGHTLLPLQVVPEFFDYQDSVWGEGVRANSLWVTLYYAIGSLLGTRGFLWYNPLLFLLIPLFVKESISGKTIKLESRIFALTGLIFITYYFIFTPNYGGWSYSIRWFVPLLPYFFIYLFKVRKYLDSRRDRQLIGVVVGFSILISLIGLINPWSNPEIHAIPVIANLKQLFRFML